jgi:hypothetical protein
LLVRSRQVQFLAAARSNDLTFVDDVDARLLAVGVETWIFGGLAEELLGLASPRPHRDLDLLYPAPDFHLADQFMAEGREVSEIPAERFPHKRAFLNDGIMVELTLVQAARSGRFCTFFCADTAHRWPDDVFNVRAAARRVASPAALREYRTNHSRLAWSPNAQQLWRGARRRAAR